MSGIAHLSDLHFGTEDDRVVAALAYRLQQLAPDMIVVSGDLTQRAQRRQFAAAERFLDTLECRLLVVPGNHDIPLYNLFARALWPFRRYHERFGTSDIRTATVGNVRLVGINTARRERHASGRITGRQRRRVIRFVQAGPVHAINIVVLHHPLLVEQPQDAIASVEHGTSTLREWADAGVDMILSGHVHHPFVLQAPATVRSAQDIWMLNAGTAVSRRVRHGYANSFNWIDTGHDDEARRLRVERWDYRPAGEEFARHSMREIALAARH